MSNFFELVSDYKQADAVLLWNDLVEREREIALTCNYLGIPTLIFQHGLRATREYSPPFCKPLIANKILVWGPKDKERLQNVGISSKDVIITGSTLFEKIPEKQVHNGINVVFAPMHWYEEHSENIEIAKKLLEIKGINLITKMVDRNEVDPIYLNPIITSANAKNHKQVCWDLLAKTDLVVSATESTFEFMAYALGIPVIVVNNWIPKFHMDRIFLKNINSDNSSACIMINIDDLIITINNILFQAGAEQRIKEREIALELECGFGFDQLTPTQRFINAITNEIQRKKKEPEKTEIQIFEDTSSKLSERLTKQEKAMQRYLYHLFNF